MRERERGEGETDRQSPVQGTRLQARGGGGGDWSGNGKREGAGES